MCHIIQQPFYLSNLRKNGVIDNNFKVNFAFSLMTYNLNLQYSYALGLAVATASEIQKE